MACTALPGLLLVYSLVLGPGLAGWPPAASTQSTGLIELSRIGGRGAGVDTSPDGLECRAF